MFGVGSENRVKHNPAGGRKTGHGITYPLILLMYTFLRGLKTGDDFLLGAEVEEAGKFDDLVYRYRKKIEGKKSSQQKPKSERENVALPEYDTKRINRLMQIKIKSKPKASKITLNNLLSENLKDDFCMIVYFDSYMKIKASFSEGEEDIGDVIIYTNGQIKLEDTKEVTMDDETVTFIMKDTFKEREVDDELFKTKLHCFRKDTEERGKWVKFFMESSKRKDSEERVELAKYLKRKSARMDRKERDKIENYLKEKSSRMNVEEREIFEKYLTGKSSGKDRNELAKYLTENPLGIDADLEGDVHIFLDKLSMAFDQPEEEKLKKMVRKELMLYVNSNVNGAYSQFHTAMHNWLMDINCFYLDQKDGLKLIEDLIGKYGRLTFGVDRPVLNFSGRENELKYLKEAFDAGKKRVVICGLGGVGKTQLARKFAERHSESYSCVLWLKSDSYEDLKESFERLAFERLGIEEKTVTGKEKDVDSVLKEMKETLKNRKCFFFFDNVQYMPDERRNLDVFLSYLPENAELLMSSRCRDWNNFDVYSLEPLSDDDASLLISESLNDHVKFENEQVRELAEVMQNFPLALQQAIAYIKKATKHAKRIGEDYSIGSYLEKFKENYKELLEHPVQEHNEDRYQNTTLTTWNITMEDIRNDKQNGALSESILCVISYFFADGIAMSDIIQCFRVEGKKKVKSAISLLDEYSMVDLLNGRCSVHRLVQKITRLKLKGEEEEHGVLYSVLAVCWRLIWKEKEEEEALLDSLLKVCEKLSVLNVVSIWEHCVKHEELVRKHSKMPKGVIENLNKKGRYAEGYEYGKRLVQVMRTILDPKDKSLNEVNFALAVVTFDKGSYGECYEIFKKVWRQSCKISGENHRITLNVKNKMAEALTFLGRHEECEVISKEVFEKCEMILGREDGDSIRARLTYSQCIRMLGKLDESYKITKEALGICETIFGTQYSEYIEVRRELAQVLMDMERCNESMDILMVEWERTRNNKGEENESTLFIRYSMGVVHLKLGNHAESKAMLENVYEGRKRILGEEHPETLNTRHYMGVVQSMLGNYSASLEILESVYECRRRTLGEEHENTLNTRHSMGVVQFKLCVDEESKEKFESLYECRRRTLGEKHPDTLIRMYSMGEVQLKLCNYAASLELFQSVYERRRRTLGEEHPQTLVTRNYMGRVQLKLRNYAASLDILESVYECRWRILGEEHPNTLVTMYYMGRVLLDLCNYAPSLEIFECVYECRRRTLGEEHPDTLLTMNYMGRVKFMLCHYAASLEIFKNVYEWRRRALGEEHPDTLVTMNYMGRVQLKLCNFAASLEIFQSVYECRRRILGDEHPDTLLTMNYTGRVQLKLCNYVASLEILGCVYECRRRTLGEEHPDTLLTRNYMGRVQLKLCNYVASLEIFQSVYECRRRTLGEEHPDTLVTRNYMSRVQLM